MEQCITCGFLCKHVPDGDIPTPKFFEMDSANRKSGEVFRHTVNSFRGSVYAHPMCFRGIDTVNRELETASDSNTRFLEIATKERQCGKWILYEHGFSPKDHLQDLRMNELELKRQQFQKQMADDQNNLMLKLDADQKVINRKNRLFQWILFGVATAEVIVGLLQVLYPTGWPPLQSLFGITPVVQPIPTVPPMPPM